MESENQITFVQNPKLDYLFGYFGNEEIRTKQDKFKPIEVLKINSDGTEEILKNFYVKSPGSEVQQSFETQIKELARKSFPESEPIKKPQEFEIFLTITMKEKRFKEVDVDNLAKSILDSLNGIVYEDDSQVSSLIVKKSVHDMKVDSIMIGIIKLNVENRGFVGDISLFKEAKEW